MIDSTSKSLDDSPEGKDGPIEGWTTLIEFHLSSQAGNEKIAMKRVAEAVGVLSLPDIKLERLKTAVAEATMNAIEHGNQFNPDLPVLISVLASKRSLIVRISDESGDRPISERVIPDLGAKLAGLQSPRGWGLFLIESMVDEVRVSTDSEHHTVELVMNL